MRTLHPECGARDLTVPDPGERPAKTQGDDGHPRPPGYEPIEGLPHPGGPEPRFGKRLGDHRKIDPREQPLGLGPGAVGVQEHRDAGGPRNAGGPERGVGVAGVEHESPSALTKKPKGKAKPMRKAKPNPRLTAKCKVCGRAMPEGWETCSAGCCLKLAELRRLTKRDEMPRGLG